MRKILTTLLLMGCYTQAFALFCPKSFNQMNIGDSIEQIQAQCGKPDGIKITKAEEKGPQQWDYYVTPQTPGYAMPSTPTGQQASVKMTIAFNEGKVVNITANGMSLAATTLCGGNISVGDSTASVKSSCGNPVIVNKSNSGTESKPDEITEYKYDSTPPVILIFVNGTLTERK
jgi:hypothetical protein